MSEQERIRIELEVSTRQDRERRERTEHKQIERDSEIDWRSYERHSIPSRWKTH